ncbi:hypothetical protein D7Y40_00445 [Stenotrophomonas maltophilia]|nr:hypothetical protein [Stenotrophomonas maltophilia]MBA0539180.1 hypothetical protein [Stenotrophomonas maltophilia]QGM07973.1 hypothetical protein FEO84_00930 [Stenotrophomonas maltophilia]REC86715.1 hypothetical protein DXK52_00995 [Stenotrophomonas maltophilia]
MGSDPVPTNGRHPPTAAGTNSSNQLSKAGWVRLRGCERHGCRDQVSGVTSWTGLRRPPQPDPPRHPTECPLLLLRLPASGRHYRRCRAAALQTRTPLTARNARSGRNRAD